nr:TetR/AcrR family transcriptional regulator [Staphylococcus aureus]
MKETDLRVIKTKKLLQLLEQHLFQTITVNQICHNALVHRTTFYKHFYDKYDLLEYLFNQLTKASLIEGFLHWIKDEKIDWPSEEIDKIFHKVINIKIK